MVKNELGIKLFVLSENKCNNFIWNVDVSQRLSSPNFELKPIFYLIFKFIYFDYLFLCLNAYWAPPKGERQMLKNPNKFRSST